uniref:Uncharacterized protein n=1 Tax=Cucumis melo TaxID=3656 RepID=A0A9I9EKN0_CUCME
MVISSRSALRLKTADKQTRSLKTFSRGNSSVNKKTTIENASERKFFRSDSSNSWKRERIQESK